MIHVSDQLLHVIKASELTYQMSPSVAHQFLLAQSGQLLDASDMKLLRQLTKERFYDKYLPFLQD